MIPDNSIIDIGARREVFWDYFLIEDKLPGSYQYPRADLCQQEPQKKEIVLRLDKSWEGKVCGYFHYFHDGRQFRFYYRASDGNYSKEIPDEKSAATASVQRLGKGACICVLLSDDGINWARPDLGLVEFNGSKKNNIVFRADELDNFFVYRDENPDCRDGQQYKAVTQGPKTAELPGGGLWAWVSPDGFSWTLMSAEPVIMDGYFDTLNTVHWDKNIGRYRLYFRGFHGENETGKCRDIRLALSEDFLHWGEEKILRYGDAPDEQLYTNGILPYYRAPHIHTGFPVRYTERKWEPMFGQLPHPKWRMEKMKRFNEPRLGTALTDGLFMTSRDGLNFMRYDEPFLKPGLFSENNWVYGDCYQGWGLLETSTEVTGNCPQKEISFFAGEDYTSLPVGIRRYTIRLDGFACMHAGAAVKQIVTRPLIFTGNTLTLNVATSAAGFIMTEFLDAEGNSIPGFSGVSGYRMFGDDTALRAIFWRGQNASGDLSPLEGKPVRIRFTLKEARLYSMQFVQQEIP
ncbi:MAG: hypothetical protein FWF22_00705 [Treponema sp.]|nr:hypothetical protein [Treponema sp.]